MRMLCNRNSHSLLIGMQSSTATLEYSLAVPYKTKHTLTIWSSNHVPWYLPKGGENSCPHKTCTQMFIVALFIIAQTWKQPSCPSVDKCINKVWYMQTIEYYSALKENELSSHEKTWRNLNAYYQVKEAKLKRPHTHCMMPTICHSGKGKTVETMKRSMVARSEVGGVGEGGINRQSTEDSWGIETILHDTIMANTWHYARVKIRRVCNTKSES